jgi:hypothetical protein
MWYDVGRGFPVVVPLLAYGDLGAALGWLARVFGFSETLRFEDEAATWGAVGSSDL